MLHLILLTLVGVVPGNWGVTLRQEREMFLRVMAWFCSPQTPVIGLLIHNRHPTLITYTGQSSAGTYGSDTSLSNSLIEALGGQVEPMAYAATSVKCKGDKCGVLDKVFGQDQKEKAEL
jgi:hypothetical protein